MLKYIPISLFVLCSAYFDMKAPSLKIQVIDASYVDVYWSVFYFVSIYAAWLVHCIVESFKNKLDLLFFGGMGTGLIIRIFLEVKKIGMDYENYINSINSFESNLLLTLYLIIVLSITLVQIWKQLKR